MFDVLAADVVERRTVAVGDPFDLPGGLTAELFMAPGKIPLYLERGAPETAAESGSNVGVAVTAGRARLAFVPGAAAVTPALRRRLADADVVFFDGTLFTDDEMTAAGAGTKTGRRMGHMPIDGRDGTLAALSDLKARRIFIHINNTNPVLVAGSPERGRVEAAGWEVASDGMVVAL
jgi:pyrroloquinoline quinone biosynthesis protein B